MIESIGKVLETTRLKKNLNIAQVSKSTRIRPDFIRAMEMDDFSALPSPVQARGFLRAYGEFLGLDSTDLLSRLGFSNGLRIQLQLDPAERITNGTKEFKPDSVIPIPPLEEPLKEHTPNFDVKLEESLAPSENQPEEFTLKEQADSKPGIAPSGLKESRIIFASIGEAMRDQREALSLSLDEVERHTHVRKHYLESLEEGEFEQLPSSVQTRGMITNYARFLEIDVDEILLQFATGLQAERLERQPPAKGNQTDQKPPRKGISFLRKYLSIDMVFGGGLIILLVGFALWGTARVLDIKNSPDRLGAAPSISDVILTPLPSGTPMKVDTSQPGSVLLTTPTIEETQLAGSPGGQPGQVQVSIIVIESTWMRVSVDGKIEFEGRAYAGSAYPFDAINQVEILTGNGSALQIIYNQTDLGVMGTFGEVVNKIYTQTGILEPTATITSTPTISPTPTATARISSTPLPTKTTQAYPTP